VTRAATECRRRFLRWFPRGFHDETYLAWERSYKEEAHQAWRQELPLANFRRLLASGRSSEVAARAQRIEGRTNLLFSFEKMALRDAVRSPAGARRFSEGLYEWLHGSGAPSDRFDTWCSLLAALPRRQTRVLTWPVATVFGFLAQPDRHIFVKPNVTRIAVARYGLAWQYETRPNGRTYQELLSLAAHVQQDLRDLRPRDLIDVQSFLWVQGSEEYRGRTFRSATTTRVYT
jgi:hypothetical protein